MCQYVLLLYQTRNKRGFNHVLCIYLLIALEIIFQAKRWWSSDYCGHNPTVAKRLYSSVCS